MTSGERGVRRIQRELGRGGTAASVVRLLLDEPVPSYAEVGKRLGISRQRVGQIAKRSGLAPGISRGVAKLPSDADAVQQR